MTLITDEDNALAARKGALSFHTRNDIKSINEIQPHTLDWSALNALEKDARKSASAMIDRAASASDDDKANCEMGVNAFEGLLTEIRSEKDERAIVGNKGPRPEKTTRAQADKRPEYTPANTADEVETESPSLRSDQSMADWVGSRMSAPESAAGMNIGGFLRAMIVQDKTEAERRALAEATDSAGGYTVPDILSSRLIDKARAQSVVMRAGAQTVPLTSDKNTIAKVLTDPTPAWREEAGALANEDATFGAVVLTPRSLAVSVDISAELMADSLNLSTALPDMLAAAMAVELDRVALNGSGTTPEPLGVANTTGIGTFAQDAATANYANLSRARTAVLTANRGPMSAYVMHPREEGVFVDLTDADNNPLLVPRQIAEIPMLTTTSLPVDLGTGNDESLIIGGNFNHLLVGIRSAIQVELFKGPKYVSNLQYTLIAHMRADIAVQDPLAFYTLTGVGQP